MTPEPEVDWTGIKPVAAGPRTYTGPEVEAKAIWKCPACGSENTTALQEGCPSCGSGKPGRHVGVDKVITAEERARLLATAGPPAAPFKWVTAPPQPLATGSCDEAFAIWAETQQLRAAAVISSYPAFKAGWEARDGMADSDRTVPSPEPVRAPELPETRPTDGGPGAEGPPVEDEPADFRGTAEQRTILAALIYFRDQVLPEAAEEVGTGQWLSLADVNRLIDAYERAVA
jgi:hypothetical protein